MPKDVRIIQEAVLSADLYRDVVLTETALRHSSEYDTGTVEDRRFAILCWALQQSADGRAGTCMTLAGAHSSLAALRAEKEGL